LKPLKRQSKLRLRRTFLTANKDSGRNFPLNGIAILLNTLRSLREMPPLEEFAK
jgi:hypothetical protein